MKKITLTLFAILLTTVLAMAQAQIGLKVGYNSASISDGDAYGGNFGDDVNLQNEGEESWRSGLVVGLAGNFVVSSSFSVLTELNWTQRGTEFQSLSGDSESSIRLNYVELPVLAKIGFGEAVRGYFTLGPTFSYATGGYVEVDQEAFDISFVPSAAEFEVTNAEDIQVNEERVNRFEFGGAIGGGVQFNTVAGDFLLDLRYTAGFTDLIEENEGVYNLRAQEAQSFRNRILSISLIYLWPPTVVLD